MSFHQMTSNVVDMLAFKAARNAIKSTSRTAHLKMELLHGPITAEIVDALEELSDEELEAFFRARARARLDEVRAD